MLPMTQAMDGMTQAIYQVIVMINLISMTINWKEKSREMISHIFINWCGMN